MGFITWSSHACGVQEQAAGLAVFEERTRGSRVQRVRASHRGREIIENQADWQTLEESPRLLQPFDGGLDRLLDQRPQKGVPAVHEHDQEAEDDLALPSDGID